jgi:hypothetical protein
MYGRHEKYRRSNFHSVLKHFKNIFHIYFHNPKIWSILDKNMEKEIKILKILSTLNDVLKK